VAGVEQPAGFRRRFAGRRAFHRGGPVRVAGPATGPTSTGPAQTTISVPAGGNITTIQARCADSADWRRCH